MSIIETVEIRHNYQSFIMIKSFKQIEFEVESRQIKENRTAQLETFVYQTAVPEVSTAQKQCF